MIDALLDLYDAPLAGGSDQVLTAYFLGKREAMDELLLATVTEETGLSKSTILRYCQRMGMARFTDFRQQFLQDLKGFRAEYCQMPALVPMAVRCAGIWRRHLVVFGEEDALRIWRLYTRDFYQKGYLLSTWSRDMKDATSIYTGLHRSLRQFISTVLADTGLMRFCMDRQHDTDCVHVAPETSGKGPAYVFPLEKHAAWEGKAQLMQAIETILGCME